MLSSGSVLAQLISNFKRFLCDLPPKMAISYNIASMRTDYNLGRRLDPDNMPAQNPIEIFEKWFDEAKNTDGIGEANAMTVATATRSGIPSARVVLLKGFDKRGFRFFTNYQSQKGQELEENPNAALVFFWQPLHRQVRIQGPVERLSDAESTEYFHSRPVGSQIGACVSDQSVPIPSRQVLIDKEKELNEKYASCDNIPRPSHWGGYCVVPKIVEFWQGQSNRLHDRVVFRRTSDCTLGERQSNDTCETNPCWKNGKDGWIYARLSP